MAFDMINHSILLQKLEKMYGFRGSALRQMESYFTHRYQYTKSVTQNQDNDKLIAAFLKGRP